MRFQSQKQGGPITGIFISLIFLVAGTIGTVVFLMVMLKDFRSNDWPETSATMIESAVVEPGVEADSAEDPDSSSWRARVLYEYEVDGTRHRSEMLSLGSELLPVFESPEEAAALVRKYPSGSTTVCFYNPEDPSKAVLEKTSPFLFLFVLIPSVFSLGGAIGLVYSVRGLSAKRRGSASEGSKLRRAAKSSQATGKWLLFGMGSIFLLVGVVAFYFLGVKVLGKAFASENWDETPCVIATSRVASSSDSDGTTYSIEITYRYTHSGQVHTGSKWNFLGGSSSGYDGKAAIVDQYPPGKEVVCYVNPENPTESVLNPGFQVSYLLGLLPLLFAVAGIGLLIAAAKMKIPAKPAPDQSVLAGVPASFVKAADPLRPDFDIPGAVELKPATGRMVMAFTLLGISLFWNGIISVFLWEAASSWRRGQGDWFLTLFMIPFVLVGLGLVVACIRAFLFLLASRLHITLNPGSLFCGKPSGMSWRFSGGITQPENLLLYLEGMEEAKYRQGTSTHTAHNVFYREELLRANSTIEASTGNVLVNAPPDLPPSFDATNNKILWKISARYKVPLLPDGKEDFPVTLKLLPER